jgi:hypothetical protein
LIADLFQAYTPLIFWTGLGIITCRWLPSNFPHFLGRGLYWVGVPIEIFALARQSPITNHTELSPVIAIGSILTGLLIGWCALFITKHYSKSTSPIHHYSFEGSFLICSMLGNTGFVGLALVPFFVPEQDLSWAILYSITQNVFGTYGLGVLVASYFGRMADIEYDDSTVKKSFSLWVLLRDLLTVPSLWGFAIGTLSRSIPFSPGIESTLHSSLWVVIPTAFLLMGIRLSQIHGWQSLKLAIVPSVLKVISMPLIVGLILTVMGFTGGPRLAIVLMAGMPSAFAGLILAEEYHLSHDLISSSIIVSTIVFLLVLPLWLMVFPV